MLSVTSETAANVSFQGAPQRPARSDPSPGNDSFGALVDSNTAADASNDAAVSAAPQLLPPQRPADATPAAGDGDE